MLQEFGLEQMVMQYERITNRCMTPIHMQILDAEQLTLARMRNTLIVDCGLTWKNIKECRVDSCLIQAGSRREEVVLEKIQQYERNGELSLDDHKKAMKEAEKYTGTQAKVANIMNGVTKTTTRYSHTKWDGKAAIDQTKTHTRTIDALRRHDLYKIYDWIGVGASWMPAWGDGAVFRAEQLTSEQLEKTRLKGNYNLPVSDAEPPEPPLEWKWHDRETALQAVVEKGESVFISGIGGTGKSHTMKEMVKRLQEKDVHVKIIAKCHVASLNAGQGLNEGTAMTAQAFVHQYNSVGGFTKGVLVLEELMTMDTGILHAISSRKKMGVQFIVLGDRNQHPAIGDSFNGMPCDERSVLWRGGEDRENNNWIKTMCDCNRLHLTEPKRCSADDLLWVFYSNLRLPTYGIDDGGAAIHVCTLADMIEKARRYFPWKKPTQWNLTVSHATRKRINKAYNEMGAKGRKDAVWVEKSNRHSPNEPQDMWLYPGLILIAYISCGKMSGVHNGQLFEIQSIASESVMLRDIESMEKYELKLEFVRDNLRLGFAFTNVGCQGRSLGNFACDKHPERGITIWDTNSQHFTLARLFTGTSRSRSGDLLQVV